MSATPSACETFSRALGAAPTAIVLLVSSLLVTVAAGAFPRRAGEPAKASAEAGRQGFEPGPLVAVSADEPGLLHSEPYLAVDPGDPTHLVAAAIVTTGAGDPTWIDVFVSGDGFPDDVVPST